MSLYERGLQRFDSLTPLERDAFVLHDLDIYYEMEGDFADYLLSGGHSAQLDWLADTLQRIGELDSAQILASLMQMDDSRRDEMQPLCERYFGLRHKRWERLIGYLSVHDAEFVEKI
jgi:hypothetical protein